MQSSRSIPHDLQEKVFKKLLLINENKQCVDCSRKNPSWATLAFGAFICMDCSGFFHQISKHKTKKISKMLNFKF